MTTNTYRPYGQTPSQDEKPRQEGWNNTGKPYANRYQRNPTSAMDMIYGSGPYFVGLVSFLLTVSALVALVAMDAVTGKYAATHMLNNNDRMGIFMSLGTTGVVLAAVGTFMYGVRDEWNWKILVLLALAAAVPIVIDVYFDAMSVDIIRFGQFVDFSSGMLPANFPPSEVLPHKLFRVMVGALSAVGEPLAATSVIIFPVMKELFKGVL